jgi:hypothetical protein
MQTSNTIVPRYNVDTCATIVEFNVSEWTARKLDRGVSEEIVAAKSAQSKDSARVNKNLMAGRCELDNIHKFVAATRVYVYGATLPWSDNGQRLLPAAQFAAFDDAMKKREEQFVSMVSEFITLYPSLITGQALVLAGMFDRNDYPSPSAIASKFSWTLDYSPVPATGHFIIDVGNAAQAELQRKLAERSDKRVEQAIESLFGSVKDHLERMAKQLTVEVGPDGKERKGKLYDSLLDSGIEICDRIKALNIINDPKLESMRHDMLGLLNTVDMDDLRKAEGARQEVKAKVNDLLDKFSF